MAFFVIIFKIIENTVLRALSWPSSHYHACQRCNWWQRLSQPIWVSALNVQSLTMPSDSCHGVYYSGSSRCISYTCVTSVLGLNDFIQEMGKGSYLIFRRLPKLLPYFPRTGGWLWLHREVFEKLGLCPWDNNARTQHREYISRQRSGK